MGTDTVAEITATAPVVHVDRLILTTKDGTQTLRGPHPLYESGRADFTVLFHDRRGHLHQRAMVRADVSRKRSRMGRVREITADASGDYTFAHVAEQPLTVTDT